MIWDLGATIFPDLSILWFHFFNLLSSADVRVYEALLQILYVYEAFSKNTFLNVLSHSWHPNLRIVFDRY